MVSGQNVKEISFFVVIFVTFYIGWKITSIANNNINANKDLIAVLIGAVATLLLFTIFYLAKFKIQRDNFQITPAAMCRGGSYMWQGDSDKAQMCRSLASTENGLQEISQYDCGGGYNGMPLKLPQYSSNSDSNWKGIPCTSPSQHPGV